MIDLIDSLIGYVNDIKPYHTKIFGVEVEYVVNDNVSVTVTEDLHMVAHLGLPLCSILNDQLSIVGSPTFGWGAFQYDNISWDKLRNGELGTTFCVEDDRHPIVSLGHDGYPHDSSQYDVLEFQYLRRYPELGQPIPKPTGFLDYALTTITEHVTFDTTIVGTDVPDSHTIIHRMWDNPLDGIRIYAYYGNIIKLRGDYTYLFEEYGSEPFPIINSMNNNGWYVADNVSYDQITNITSVEIVGATFDSSVPDGLIYIGLYDAKEWDGNSASFITQPDANINAASSITECFKIQDGYGFDDPNTGFDATIDDTYDVPAGEYHNPLFFDSLSKWDDGYYVVNGYSSHSCAPCNNGGGFSSKPLDTVSWDRDLLPQDGGSGIECDTYSNGIVVFSPYKLPTPNPIPSYDSTFVQDTPSDTWVIDHNLGYYPIVRAFSGGIEVQPVGITFISLNRVVLTFSSPIQGVVRVV